MLLLSFVWLALVVAELAFGASKLLETFGTVIWVVFLLEFALRFALAPEKLPFLRREWLTVIALLVPALRLVRALRVLQAARALRGFRLVRIVGTANRGMNALRAASKRRGLGLCRRAHDRRGAARRGRDARLRAGGRGRGRVHLLCRRAVVDEHAARHHGVGVLAQDARRAASCACFSRSTASRCSATSPPASPASSSVAMRPRTVRGHRGLDMEWIHWVTRAVEIAGTAIIVVGAFGALLLFVLGFARRRDRNALVATSGRALAARSCSGWSSWSPPTSSTRSRSSPRFRAWPCWRASC